MTTLPLSLVQQMVSGDFGVTVGEAIRNKPGCEVALNLTLVESMKASGQTTPVCVDSGTLCHGHHRVKAATYLGWQEIQATQHSDATCDRYTSGGVECDELDFDWVPA